MNNMDLSNFLYRRNKENQIQSNIEGFFYKFENEGFLHRHKKLEQELHLNENHVIVDKEDWEKVRQNIRNQELIEQKSSKINKSISKFKFISKKS